MTAANKPIEPPETVPLTDDELPLFDSIISEIARADWTSHTIELAAMLAKMMADYIRESDLLRVEGAVTVGGMGGPVPNPRKQIVQMNAANIVSFRRSLALHARAQGGNARDIAKRRAIAKSFEAEFDDDELIPHPH
jgi:hypothetical protein